MHVRKRDDPSLGKIVVIILLVGIALLGIAKFSQWFNEKYIGGNIAATAPASIAEAEQHIDEGAVEEARRLLNPIVKRLDDPALTPRAMMLLARIERDAGNVEGARELLERASQEFPTSAEQPRAMIALARLLEDAGQVEEARALYQTVRDNAPPKLRAPATAAVGRYVEREGELARARDLYREAVSEAEWGGEAWNEALDAMGRLNVKLIFAPQETPDCKYYTVEPGDTITGIGIKLNTTQGLLLRANGIEDASKLRPGQRLKYTPKDFQIVIERSSCQLFLLDDGGLFKRYAVGLGKKGHETTLGNYKIGSKQKDPTWYCPEGRVIPPGDPENELGTRWMPLVPEEEGLPSDLGIHGTIAPETLGEFSSKGCARMIPEEVEELYDLVVRSTPVSIVETYRQDGAVTEGGE